MDSISEINITLVNNIKDLDVVMSMYNLIKYSENYSKISGRSWQYQMNQKIMNHRF